MDKALPETDSPPSRPRSLSGTREVLVWLNDKEATSDEQVKAPEPSYESCKLALEAEHLRLKKGVTQKDQKDPSLGPALSEYIKQYRALEAAIVKKSRPSAAILLEIPKLQAAFRRGLALLPVKQAEAAKSELASLKEGLERG